jgi:hypothetical protein
MAANMKSAEQKRLLWSEDLVAAALVAVRCGGYGSELHAPPPPQHHLLRSLPLPPSGLATVHPRLFALDARLW